MLMFYLLIVSYTGKEAVLLVRIQTQRKLTSDIVVILVYSDWLNLHYVSVQSVEVSFQCLLTSQNFIREHWSSRLEVLLLKQNLFPLRFMCWMQLCVTVTVNTHCSPSPSSQLHGDWEGRERRETVCACVRICRLWLSAPLYQQEMCVFAVWDVCAYLCVCLQVCGNACLSLCVFCMGRNVCVCVCVPDSQLSVVFSTSLTVILLSAICLSLKRQLFSKGPVGENETTGRLRFFFYPHKDVLLLPVLLFFQEVFAVRLFPFCLSVILFIHVLLLSFSHISSLSLKWWCWLCFSVKTLPLFPFVFLLVPHLLCFIFFLMSIEAAKIIHTCFSVIRTERLQLVFVYQYIYI